MRWAALSLRPPILRGVSASQIRADHAANQPRIITATNRGLGARQANRSSGDLCVSPDNGALPGVQAVDSYNRHSLSRCSSAQYIFDFSVQVTRRGRRPPLHRTLLMLWLLEKATQRPPPRQNSNPTVCRGLASNSGGCDARSHLHTSP